MIKHSPTIPLTVLPSPASSRSEGRASPSSAADGFRPAAVASIRGGVGSSQDPTLEPVGGASTSGGPPRHSAICKYYVNTGKCYYGDQCRFLHSVPSVDGSADGDDDKASVKKARSQWVQDRHEKRRELATD